jgi:hypothetical protein
MGRAQTSQIRAPVLVMLALAIVLLSGCVNVNVRQKVTSEGTMTGSMNGTLDLTDLYLSYGVPRENFSQLDSVMYGSVCGNITSSPGNLTNIRCGVQNAVVTVSADFRETNLTEKDGFYRSYGLFNTEYLLVGNVSSITGGDSGMFDIGTLIQAKKKGASISYVIEMPSDAYEVGGGRLVNETDSYGRTTTVAKFDFIDVMTKGDQIYVRSREPNFLPIFLLTLLGLGAAFLPPALRWLIHPKRDKSLYKDGLGILWTILQVVGILMLNFFFLVSAIVYGSFPDQGWVVIGVMLFPALELYSIFIYLGFDFEVTKDGIFSRQNFMEKRFKFSEIKKVERAEMDSIFFLGDWKVATPSGTKVHPSETWYNGHAARKGVLISLKSGKSVYVLVKDIDWVIDSIKEQL